MAEDVPAVLQAMMGADAEQMEAASSWLLTAREADLPMLMLTLAQVLESAESTAEVRMQAGIQLKNCLTGQHDNITEAHKKAWSEIDVAVRNSVKESLLRTLGTEVGVSSCARVIATIAIIEVPLGAWDDVIDTLIALYNAAGENRASKIGVLDALGYITEGIATIDKSLLARKSDDILEVVVQSMGNGEPDLEIRLSASKALLHALGFCEANFETEHERNTIMEVVCEATQNTDSSDVQVSALQCLVRIGSMYYRHLVDYMDQALFGITLYAMASDNNDVKLQGVEFWTQLAENEQVLEEEAAEARAISQAPEVVSSNYVLGALKHLIPQLFELIATLDESDEPTDWSPAKAATLCLEEISHLVKDEVLKYTVPFLEGHIQDESWQVRNACLLAFGHSLDGPDESQVTTILNQALPHVCSMMEDPSMQVRDSCAWLLGKVATHLPSIALSDMHLMTILGALGEALSQEPQVAFNACYSLSDLVEGARSIAEDLHAEQNLKGHIKQHALSEQYATILGRLMETTERTDGAEAKVELNQASYESIMTYISCYADDCYPAVTQCCETIMQRMILALENPGTVDPETMALLCSCITTLLFALKIEDVHVMGETTMIILKHMFEAEASGNMHQDAFCALSQLIERLEGKSSEFTDYFAPAVLQGLQTIDDPLMCGSAVGVVSAYCRALGPDVVAYAEPFMQALFADLSNPELASTVRPQIVAVFGDMSFSLGPQIAPYAEVILQLIDAETEKVAQPVANETDYDAIDDRNEMRENCLQAYSLVIQGLVGPDMKSPDPKVELAIPHISHIFEFISTIMVDAQLTEAIVGVCCALVGDICLLYPQVVSGNVPDEFSLPLIQTGLNASDSRVRVQAQYMQEKVSALS